MSTPELYSSALCPLLSSVFSAASALKTGTTVSLMNAYPPMGIFPQCVGGKLVGTVALLAQAVSTVVTLGRITTPRTVISFF